VIGYGTSVRCRSNEKMVILGFQSAAPRRTLTLGPLHMTSCGAESVIATTGIPQPARHKGLMNPRLRDSRRQLSCLASKMVILGFQSAAPRRTLTLGPLHMTSCGAESVIATTGIPQPARHKGLMNPRFTLPQVLCLACDDEPLGGIFPSRGYPDPILSHP
jgi:hypothetical protein